MFFHWDEGGDVASADRAGLLGCDELFTARLTHAEVAARHDQGVFGV